MTDEQVGIIEIMDSALVIADSLFLDLNVVDNNSFTLQYTLESAMPLALSLDGTTIVANSPGTIITTDGIWSSAMSGLKSTAKLLLNGLETEVWMDKLEVLNGGQLYLQNGNTWWVYSSDQGWIVLDADPSELI